MKKNKNGVCDLAEKKCKPCEGGASPLTEAKILDFLKNIPEWKYDQGKITRVFRFPDFHRTMAFVNAVAWMAHQEDHHPDMEVSYNTCTVRYHTHAIHGLSENDFICAAKINALVGF